MIKGLFFSGLFALSASLNLTAQETICDDFTSEEFGSFTISPGEVIGYTQDGVYPITAEEDCWGSVNTFEEGIYTVGGVSFALSGVEQTATFTIYAFPGQLDELGIEINEGTLFYLDETFPFTTGGVNVDLEAIEEIDSWTYYTLTFTGVLDEVLIHGFESGITELCIAEEEEETEEICDDFTSEEFGSFTISPGEVIGYTQDGVYPITAEEDCWGSVNTFEEGIYTVGGVSFALSGVEQTATFTIYAFPGQLDELGIEINEGTLFYLDETFPFTTGGVNVDLEAIEEVDSWTYYTLTFTGVLDEVLIHGFESGITELCIAEEEEETEEICDDFASADWEAADEDGILGYTQDGIYPIETTEVWSSFSSGQGYWTGELIFNFSGEEQEATFTLVDFCDGGGDQELIINGSTTIDLFGSFPMTVDGFTVTKTDLPDDGGDRFEVRISGEISTVKVIGCETVIESLCTEQNEVNSLAESEHLSIRVYPNPTTGATTISTQNNIALVSVYTHTGALIQTITGEANSSIIDLSSYPAGMYFLSITDVNEHVETIKLVKK